MKTLNVVIAILMVSLVVFGCSQKRQEVSNLSGLGLEGEDKDIVTQTITSSEPIEAQMETQPIQIEAEGLAIKAPSIKLAPEGLERNKQIQTALKNASLYFGEIDGKIGPLTRKAIEEFQKMRGLKVDGKVGPVTWGELQKYLDIEPTASSVAVEPGQKS
jgi:murein L,D-transpeptidase YcbB/YkuD